VPAGLTRCIRLADKRRMHISDCPGRSKDKETPILLISGFGAHRGAGAGSGPHVFEPFEGSGNRVTARVRLAVVPLGDVPAAKERRLVIEAIDEAPSAEQCRAALFARNRRWCVMLPSMAQRPSRSRARARSICCRPVSADAC